MATASLRCASRMPASSAAFLIAFGSETGDFFSRSTALALELATAALVALVASWGRFVPRAPAASSAAEATAKLTCNQMENNNSYSVKRNEYLSLSLAPNECSPKDRDI